MYFLSKCMFCFAMYFTLHFVSIDELGIWFSFLVRVSLGRAFHMLGKCSARAASPALLALFVFVWFSVSYFCHVFQGSHWQKVDCNIFILLVSVENTVILIS